MEFLYANSDEGAWTNFFVAVRLGMFLLLLRCVKEKQQEAERNLMAMEGERERVTTETDGFFS